MRLTFRRDKEYSFSLLPYLINRHTYRKKEWVIWWLGMKFTIIWEKKNS